MSKIEKLFRHASVRAEENESREIDLSFSSEDPYERFFGIEVLDHQPESIRLDRLEARAPLLLDHDPTRQIGVVESVRLDGDKARAVVRFSKSPLGDEVYNDVLDGIRSNVSVGYRVHSMVLERQNDESPDEYRVTDWEPLEVSIVSVPADTTVGVGRDDQREFMTRVLGNPNSPYEENRMETKDVDSAAIEEERGAIVQEREALKAERERTEAILSTAREFNALDLAEKYLGDEKASERDMLREIAKRNGMRQVDSAEELVADQPETIPAEEAKKFSFARAIAALANPQDKRAQEAAAFEYECSRAAQDAYGKESRGILVPQEVLQRDLVVGTPTAGGNTVATDLRDEDFITDLVNQLVVAQAGATVLTGLRDSVAIPRQTSGSTVYWVAENGSITESEPAFDQVTMAPKTMGAMTEISRKLLLQSSVVSEAFIQNELARRIRLEWDDVAIEGGGTNEPTGITQTSGIGQPSRTSSTNGSVIEWEDIPALWNEVAMDNAEMGSLAFMTNTKVVASMLSTTKDAGSGMFIMNDRTAGLLGYPVFVSNAVPSDLTKGSGTDLSALIFGNFADLLVGQWSGVDLLVDPYTNSATGAVRVVAFMDIDVSVRHPESFGAILDVIA